MRQDGDCDDIVQPGGRYLGTMLWWNSSFAKELNRGLEATQHGWKCGGKLWTARVRKPINIAAFQSLVIEAALSGLTAVLLSFKQLNHVDAKTSKYLRVMQEGKAQINW